MLIGSLRQSGNDSTGLVGICPKIDRFAGWLKSAFSNRPNRPDSFVTQSPRVLLGPHHRPVLLPLASTEEEKLGRLPRLA